MKQNPQKLFEQHKSSVKKYNKIIIFVQMMILFLGVVLWEFASKRDLIDPLLFSAPSTIANHLRENFSNGYFYPHIYTTMYEIVIAFLISTILGVIIASIMWWNNTVSRIIDPYLVVFNAIPKVALGPIIIIIFGPTIKSAIAMGVIISIVVTVLVVYQSFKHTDENYIKLLKSFGASRIQIFRKCVFPASINTIISAVKVNVGLAWVGVIVGEFLVSKEGLGYVIVYGFQVFNFTLVWSSLVIISIFAAIMYLIVDKLEKYITTKNSGN